MSGNVEGAKSTFTSNRDTEISLSLLLWYSILLIQLIKIFFSFRSPWAPRANFKISGMVETRAAVPLNCLLQGGAGDDVLTTVPPAFPRLFTRNKYSLWFIALTFLTV